MAQTKENPKIELWEGYEVEFSDALLKDADFVADYNKAASSNNFSDLVMLMLALVAGEGGKDTDKIYGDIREHVIADKGYFDIEELAKIVTKITDKLPKAGNRAQKHAWRTSR